MSKADYQALCTRAEKTTCGEWSLEYRDGRFDDDDALIHRKAVGCTPTRRIKGARPENGPDEGFQIEQQANTKFIAVASPATVLALLDGREKNQQHIKRRDQENEDTVLTAGKLRAELEAAEKRISELEVREAVLPNTQDIHSLGSQSVKVFCEFHRNIINRCANEIHKTGINISIRGKQEYS